MEKLCLSEKRKRIIFFILVGISFITIWIYNCLTPLMSDDLLFDPSEYHSIFDIFRLEYRQYMTWNGRSVLQIILKIFSLSPKWVFNIFNSLCFILLILLIYANIKGRKKYDCFLFLLINLLVWNFSVDFSQTVLWMGGACNYLWGIVIILGFLTLFRYFLENGVRWKYPFSACILLFLSGFLAGWGNENTSGGCILIALLYSLLYYMKNRKIHLWMVSGLFGLAVGFLFLLMAPGNKVRASFMLEEETYSGIMAYVSRGLKINEAVNDFMMIYIVIICLLCAYFIHKGKKVTDFMDIFIFSLAGLATCYALILTPEPMHRAYYGANIFFALACIQAIQMISSEDILLISLKTGGIIAAAIWMLFSYTENGADLARIMREVNEREAYILEQTEMGNKNLTLPMLRPEFQTKYSFMYNNDISDEEDFWINEVFCIKYGLDSLKAIPRNEWDIY